MRSGLRRTSCRSLRAIGVSLALLAAASGARAQMLELFVQGSMTNGRGGGVLSADFMQMAATGPIGTVLCCLVSDHETGTPNFIEATGEVDYGRIRIYSGSDALQQGNFENRDAAIFITGEIVDELTINSGTGSGTLRGTIRFDGILSTSVTASPRDSVRVSASLSIPGDPGIALSRQVDNDDGTPVPTGDAFGNYMVELRYFDGVPFSLQILAIASVQPSSQFGFTVPGGPTSAKSDLRTTFTWMGAEVLDNEGMVVPGATISSGSGFDWVVGLPEPEPQLGAIASILGLACLRRRRRASFARTQ